MNLVPVSLTSSLLSFVSRGNGPKTNHSCDGILDPSPHAKCLAVRHGSYSASGLEGKYICALRSPHKYTTNELPSCVAYGLRSWVRENARARRPSGPAWMSPRRVRVGAGGGTPPEEAVVPGGRVVLFLVLVFFRLGSGFDEWCRCWRICGRDRGSRGRHGLFGLNRRLISGCICICICIYIFVTGKRIYQSRLHSKIWPTDTGVSLAEQNS